MEFDEKEYLHAQVQICHQKMFNLLRDNATLESQNMLFQRHHFAAQQEIVSMRQQMDILRQKLSAVDPAVANPDPELDEMLDGCPSCEDPEPVASIAE